MQAKQPVKQLSDEEAYARIAADYQDEFKELDRLMTDESDEKILKFLSEKIQFVHSVKHADYPYFLNRVYHKLILARKGRLIEKLNQTYKFNSSLLGPGGTGPLDMAVESKSQAMIEWALKNSDVSVADSNGMTVLHRLNTTNPILAKTVVEAVLDKDKKLADAKDKHKMTPLKTALLVHHNFFVAAALMKKSLPGEREFKEIVQALVSKPSNDDVKMILCLVCGFPEFVSNHTALQSFIARNLGVVEQVYLEAQDFFDLRMCHHFFRLVDRFAGKWDSDPLSFPKHHEVASSMEFKITHIVDSFKLFPMRKEDSTVADRLLGSVKTCPRQLLIDQIWEAVFAESDKYPDRFKYTIKYLVAKGATIQSKQLILVDKYVPHFRSERVLELKLKESTVKPYCEENEKTLTALLNPIFTLFEAENKLNGHNNENYGPIAGLWQQIKQTKKGELLMFFLLMIQKLDEWDQGAFVSIMMVGIVHYPEIQGSLINLLRLNQYRMSEKDLENNQVLVNFFQLCQSRALEDLFAQKDLFFDFLKHEPKEAKLFCKAVGLVRIGGEKWKIVPYSKMDELINPSKMKKEQAAQQAPMAPRSLGVLPPPLNHQHSTGPGKTTYGPRPPG